MEPTTEMAQEMLSEILRLMDAEVDITIGEREGRLLLSLTGEDEGMLIGRHGETLRALQQLLSTMIHRQNRGGERTEVILDVDDYLLRRQDSLAETAVELAERALDEDRPIHAKPMDARDRRAMHVALREDPRVQTHSDGEDDDRHVVIVPTSD